MAQEKTCSTCKILKDLSEFHKHNTSKDGHSHRCKPCATERSKKWYYENREKKLEELRGDNSRHNHYMYRFKISLDEYIEMSTKQNDVCANPLCTQIANQQRNGVLVVDHDRNCCPTSKTCGKCLRGLLCQGCNKALGLLQEDKERIRGLIMYLEEYSSALVGDSD